MKFLSRVALFLLLAPLFIGNKIYSQSLGKPSPIKEPYPYVCSGGFLGRAMPESPDPIVSYNWNDPKSTDGLEIYTLKPVQVVTENPLSFHDLNSLTNDSPNVTVTGTGSVIRMTGK